MGIMPIFDKNYSVVSDLSVIGVVCNFGVLSMKLKYKLIVFASIFAILFSWSFCAMGVPEDEGDEPAYTEVQTETEAEPETEPETEEETESPTEKPTEAKEEETQKPTKVIAALQDYEDLPSAPVDEEPTAVSVDAGDNGDMTYGLVSWVCVIIGVLTIIFVVISNKSHYIGGVGKPRYSEGNRITGQQKRLLDDEFYNTRKYRSYIDDEPRR